MLFKSGSVRGLHAGTKSFPSQPKAFPDYFFFQVEGKGKLVNLSFRQNLFSVLWALKKPERALLWKPRPERFGQGPISARGPAKVVILLPLKTHT